VNEGNPLYQDRSGCSVDAAAQELHDSHVDRCHHTLEIKGPIYISELIRSYSFKFEGGKSNWAIRKKQHDSRCPSYIRPPIFTFPSHAQYRLSTASVKRNTNIYAYFCVR